MGEPITNWEALSIEQQLGQAWGRPVTQQEVDDAMGAVKIYSVPFADEKLTVEVPKVISPIQLGNFTVEHSNR